MKTEKNSFTRRNGNISLGSLIAVCAIMFIVSMICVAMINQTDPEKDKKASCISNMKQIGLAFMLYRQDYSEVGATQALKPELDNLQKKSYMNYPVKADMSKILLNENNTEMFNWVNSIIPYMRNLDILVCPSAIGKKEGVLQSSYVYNGYLSRNYSVEKLRPTPTDGTAVKPLCDADIARVSEIVMAEDIPHLQDGAVISPYVVSVEKKENKKENKKEIEYTYTYKRVVFGLADKDGKLKRIIANHMTNVDMVFLFYDGHVETVPSETNFEDKWREGTKEITLFDKYYNPMANY